MSAAAMAGSTPQSLGAGTGLLSPRQRQGLARLARKAWELAGCGETFDDWRHAEVLAETGRAGLTSCENRHYLPLRARWEAMTGDRLQATKDMLRATREEVTWARASLDRACREAADVLPDARGYAAGFLRNIRQTSLEAADPKQLRDAMFTIRRRAAQLRRARSGGISAPTGDSQTAGRNARGTESRQNATRGGGAPVRVDTRLGAGSSIRGDRGGLPARAEPVRGLRVLPSVVPATEKTHLRVIPKTDVAAKNAKDAKGGIP